MKSFIQFGYFSAIILLSICNSCAQKKDDYSLKIDSLLKSTNPRIFNGVVLITQKDKVKYSNAANFAVFDKKKQFDCNTEFEIMSNSKQITAVLLLKEVEKGQVNLQSPIKKYLPNLTQTWSDSVTVHQLLNHTHGIIDLAKPLAFKPGTDFKYGNLSYSLLGQIIEFSSKKTYVKLANSLFKQLKMKNTYCYNKEKIQQLVSGHTNKNNIFTIVQGTIITNESIPAGGIISTANDLTIWNKNLHHGKLLKPKTYQLMTNYSTLSQHDVFGENKVGYGYGIRISDKTNPKFLGHTGLGDGFAAVNLYFPENDVSVIVLENQMNDNSAIYYYFETEIRKIIEKSSLTNKQ